MAPGLFNKVSSKFFLSRHNCSHKTRVLSDWLSKYVLFPLLYFWYLIKLFRSLYMFLCLHIEKLFVDLQNFATWLETVVESLGLS